MEMFFQLWLEVMLPLFFYVFIGYCFNRLFTFDLKTLTNLLVYLFLPVTVFMKMLNSPLSGQVAGGVLFFLTIQFGIMTSISYFAAKWRKLPRTMYGTFANSVALNNSGNLGLPVHALVFKNDPFAISIGVFTVLFQNVMTFTVGVYNAEATVQMKDALLKIVKLPIIYSIILGLFLQLNHISLPNIADIMLQPLAEAFAPFALITLGAQLSATGTKISWKDLGVSNILRLVGGPLIAYVIILAMGLHGVVAQVLFIGSSFPSSRNSALLSFKGPHASFAAQTVLSSTILSAITLPITIQLAMVLF